eukprot:GCRY01003319.1.p1 GENE.GCRY01003319.1~~GCRY01003319.1.p1  ORF type:complete len:1035 (-),score=316.75 GCRY01003319.1:467-3340(-)
MTFSTNGSKSAVSIAGKSYFSNCSFQNCFAQDSGGAITLNGGSSSVYNSHFSNCSSDSYGGAVYLTDESVFYVENSDFENNRCEKMGGAIAASVSGDSRLTLNSTRFLNNIASRQGGAIYSMGDVVLTLVGSLLHNNTFTWLPGNGAAIHQVAGEIQLEHSVFTHNNATSSGHGGAVSLLGTWKAGVRNCSFLYNYGGYTGGGVRLDSVTDVEITGSLFAHNEADFGGAFDLTRSTGRCLLSNCTFSDNFAPEAGGAVELDSSEAVIDNCTFHRNTAATKGGAVIVYNSAVLHLSSSVAVNSTSGVGGFAEVFKSAVLYMHNCRLENSYAILDDDNQERNGGAFYISVLGTVVVTNSTITNAYAAEDGGGVYLNEHGTLRWEGGELSDCQARRGAWLYANSGKSLALTDVRVERGSIVGSKFAPMLDRARCALDRTTLYLEDTPSRFENVSLTDSTACYGGGVVCYECELEMANCVFTRLRALMDGGAVAVWNTDTVKLTNLHISSTAAGRNGGGIALMLTNMTLENITFSECSAGGAGGAVHVLGGAAWAPTPTVRNITAVGCSAHLGGGFASRDSEPSLVLSRFLECSAEESGGAIHLENSKGTYTACHVERNSAAISGGGVNGLYSFATVADFSWMANTAPLGSNVYNNESNIALSPVGSLPDSTVGGVVVDECIAQCRFCSSPSSGPFTAAPDSCVCRDPAYIRSLDATECIAAEKCIALGPLYVVHNSQCYYDYCQHVECPDYSVCTLVTEGYECPCVAGYAKSADGLECFSTTPAKDDGNFFTSVGFLASMGVMGGVAVVGAVVFGLHRLRAVREAKQQETSAEHVFFNGEIKAKPLNLSEQDRKTASTALEMEEGADIDLGPRPHRSSTHFHEPSSLFETITAGPQRVQIEEVGSVQSYPPEADELTSSTNFSSAFMDTEMMMTADLNQLDPSQFTADDIPSTPPAKAKI